MLYDYDDDTQGAERSRGSHLIMWFILGIIVIAAIAGFAKYAHAADVRDQQGSLKDAPATTVVTASTNWSGLWIAALAGYSMSNTELNFNVFGTDGEQSFNENIAGIDGFGGEGFDGTVQLGGDIQITGRDTGRGIVIGGWAEYAFGGVESSAHLGNLRLDVEQNDSYGAFGSVGYAFGDTLIYGAGGFVWTEADVSLTDGEDTFRKTFDLSGPAAELGVRHRFKPGIQGKLSARYTWLDEETFASFGDEEFGATLKGEPGIWSVKAGVVISTEAMFGNRGTGFFSGN